MRWMDHLANFGPLQPYFNYEHIAATAILYYRYFGQELGRIQPESIAELQWGVEDVGGTILKQMLRGTAQNVRKRSKACIEASGSHFAHSVKLS